MVGSLSALPKVGDPGFIGRVPFIEYSDDEVGGSSEFREESSSRDNQDDEKPGTNPRPRKSR